MAWAAIPNTRKLSFLKYIVPLIHSSETVTVLYFLLFRFAYIYFTIPNHHSVINIPIWTHKCISTASTCPLNSQGHFHCICNVMSLSSITLVNLLNNEYYSTYTGNATIFTFLLLGAEFFSLVSMFSHRVAIPVFPL